MTGSDVVAEYLQIYREWRYNHGINDPCIDELKAVILTESERKSLSLDQRIRLQCLARAIGHEQAGLLVRAA